MSRQLLVDAVKASMRLSEVLWGLRHTNDMSGLNAEITLAQMRQDVATLTKFCDDVEQRLKDAAA